MSTCSLFEGDTPRGFQRAFFHAESSGQRAMVMSPSIQPSQPSKCANETTHSTRDRGTQESTVSCALDIRAINYGSKKPDGQDISLGCIAAWIGLYCQQLESTLQIRNSVVGART